MKQPIIVLMADDDLEDIEVIEDVMASLPLNVQFFKVMNGRAVLEFLGQRTDGDLPCLIILDYNMPELNGAEVLKALGQDPRYRSITKVVFSTSNSPRHIKECVNNGATEYFVKPTNLQDLNEVVQKMLSFCMN